MIGLALGVARSPVVFQPPEEWPATFDRFQRSLGGDTAKAEKETAEVRAEYSRRIESAYQALNAELKAYGPDTVLLIGDDNMEVFSGAIQPSLNLFLGNEIWGYKRVVRGQPPDENDRFSFRCNPELASHLLHGLVEREFDFTWNDSLKPIGRPEIGIGHAFTAPVVKVLEGLDVPVIPLMQNVRHKPIISARRCFELGKAIHDVLEARDERIAVVCTGGLSVATIDEAMDKWLLKQIEEGQQERLVNMFVVDSNNVRGETGELRNWITMSATLNGVKGTIVDYIPCFHGIAGLAFAYQKR